MNNDATDKSTGNPGDAAPAGSAIHPAIAASSRRTATVRTHAQANHVGAEKDSFRLESNSARTEKATDDSARPASLLGGGSSE
jgi:hypothetical protein